jgi:hypothetical protein
MRRVVACALLAVGLAIGLAVVSCQDERSITEARHTPRFAASVQTSTVAISPTADAFLNIDATNYGSSAVLSVYTWPDNRIANASVLKFDLATIPAGATISSATLNLNLTESDATADPTYTVTVHRILNKNPDLTRATGYTYDGTNAWTQNSCCYNNIPLAQADIGAPVDSKAVDKTPGFKGWDVTSLVRGWFSTPSTNLGLLVNSDPSKLRDRYRNFSSSEDPVASNRPYLTVAYTVPALAPPPAEPSAVFSPTGDTYLNLDAINYATSPTLNVYTWPNDTIANAIVMKFNLTSIPVGSTVSRATLSLNLTESDATTDPTYTVTAHKIINRNPDPARATGYTYDGVNAWTANGCCRNHVPLAQGDISAPVDTRSIDKTAGFKQWDVTSLVQGWLNAPSTNFGLLLNSDPSKLRDRYRSFSSSEDPVAGNRPYLTVVYTPPSSSPPPPSPEAQLGQWSAVFPAPIVQLHVHLLTDGTVLSWGRVGDPQVWDPATGTFTAVPSPSWLFCAGHDFLPDGRLLVAGGHIADGHGLPNTNLFDPATHSWQVAPPMARGRWYPNNTTLPDGEVLTVGGTDENMTVDTIPEVWDGTHWRQLTTANLALEWYPRMFVAPDGRIFNAGEEQPSRWLDVTGTGRWSDGPRRNFGPWRGYGSAVMYQPGKILYVGGGDPPTNTAEVIDLNQPNPTWAYTGSMAYARRQINATLLPTGDVLVTGGTGAPGFNNAAGAVHAAELWSPTTGTWTTLASNAVIRMYHSASLLLPDGRVLHTGSGDGANAARELSYELFSPSYLFRGARPTLTGFTPTVVGYGQTLHVDTPDGASITQVTFIRTGSVTHAFDQAGRLVPLAFAAESGGISVTIPASRTTAPPGPYMLFLVNANGVPSVGRIMRLQ